MGVLATLVGVGSAGDASTTPGQPTQWDYNSNYRGGGHANYTSSVGAANAADASRYNVSRGMYERNSYFLRQLNARRDEELRILRQRRAVTNEPVREDPDVCSDSQPETDRPCARHAPVQCRLALERTEEDRTRWRTTAPTQTIT